MEKLTTCLWFAAGQARAAATFYAATFPDSHLGSRHTAPAEYPGGHPGDELTVAFTLLGRPFVGLNGRPGFSPNQSVSFQILTEDQPETDRYWNAILAAGGTESMCGWITDPWGFSWQVTPRALIAAMTNPDKPAAARAMQAMMTMRRIDIAQIEAAQLG